MVVEQNAADTPTRKPIRPNAGLNPGFLGPLFWGGVATLAFYSLIPFLPVQREMAQRYFCNHPLEYITATLFFIGMAILLIKFMSIAAEKSVWNQSFLSDLFRIKRSHPVQTAEELRKAVEQIPDHLQSTTLAHRLSDLSLYVQGRGNTAGLEDHLKYLSELAQQRLHGSFALVRTVTWAVPILGFLGTVMGITIAIANVTPDQLSSSLNDVTSGLAVAFDTTALSLALSLMLVFSSFVVERAQGKVLDEVEEFGVKQLTGLFPPEMESASPLRSAEQQVSRELLQHSESMIRLQTERWQQELEQLRERWQETLSTQQQRLEESLTQGMTASLHHHNSELQQARGEFLQAFEKLSQHVADQLADSRQSQQTFLTTWQKSVAESLSGWVAELAASHRISSEQVKQLNRQSEILSGIVADEAQILRLQKTLNDNLQALHHAETFEETLHSLTAAVHLLTSRAKPKAA